MITVSFSIEIKNQYKFFFLNCKLNIREFRFETLRIGGDYLVNEPTASALTIGRAIAFYPTTKSALGRNLSYAMATQEISILL